MLFPLSLHMGLESQTCQTLHRQHLAGDLTIINIFLLTRPTSCQIGQRKPNKTKQKPKNKCPPPHSNSELWAFVTATEGNTNTVYGLLSALGSAIKVPLLDPFRLASSQLR